MGWFSFFKKKHTLKTVEQTSLGSPAEGILVLITLLKEQDLSRYTLRKAMQHRFTAYSVDVEQLMEWIGWMHTTVESRVYAPDKWKQVKNVIQPYVMDDYMSSEGHDVHPREFCNTSFTLLEKTCHFLIAEPEEREMQIQRYYNRQFHPILHDSYVVLKELHAIVTK